MYKIKEAARRGSALLAAASLLAGIGASAMPALVSADALNPLTERSLMLSSSAPGFVDTDGSGNHQTQYSLPGSGPNGKKTGETMTFKVSSTQSIKAFTLQYCTSPAGLCTAPGNDAPATSTPTPRGDDDDSHSDLNAHYTSPVEGTDFEVYTDTGNHGTLSALSGWDMAVSNVETSSDPLAKTGKSNFITLSTTGSGAPLASGDQVKIVFNASDTNYITNPGKDAFFVKINDYSDTAATTAVDGGVTVANVMNDSIEIQTKVLETMSFSVGTVNPATDTNLTSHSDCDSITVNQPLQLGDPDQEHSLEVGKANDAYSYWRLSSNSSNGATVYYSGYTLSNTEGDQIDAAGSVTPGDGVAVTSHPGEEQFGLGIEAPNASGDTDGAISRGFITADALDTGHGTNPTLGSISPLLTGSYNYGGGEGLINQTPMSNNTAEIAFDNNSSTVPAPIASESADVIHCATAKMRYVANIAPDTPAGVYTSKINYLASPEY